MSIRMMAGVVTLAIVVLALAWLGGGAERSEPAETQHRAESLRPHPEAARAAAPPAARRQAPDRRFQPPPDDEALAAGAEDPAEAELAELAAEEFAAHALGERLAQRGEEVRREQLGQERFARGVAEGGFSAEQMDQAVVAFLRGIELEPRLDEEGMLEGLDVKDIDEDSPLRDAGFRRGDRITQIDELPLRDPAEIPALLVGLGRDIRFCGEREGEQICGAVRLQ